MPEWDERQEMAAEKEVLGFYLTSHPLAEYEADARDVLLAHHRRSRRAAATARKCILGGMIASIKFSHTKNPRPGQANTKYAMLDLEDMDGHHALHPLARGLRQARAPWSRPTRSSPSAA